MQNKCKIIFSYRQIHNGRRFSLRARELGKTCMGSSWHCPLKSSKQSDWKHSCNHDRFHFGFCGFLVHLQISVHVSSFFCHFSFSDNNNSGKMFLAFIGEKLLYYLAAGFHLCRSTKKRFPLILSDIHKRPRYQTVNEGSRHPHHGMNKVFLICTEIDNEDCSP